MYLVIYLYTIHFCPDLRATFQVILFIYMYITYFFIRYLVSRLNVFRIRTDLQFKHDGQQNGLFNKTNCLLMHTGTAPLNH